MNPIISSRESVIGKVEDQSTSTTSNRITSIWENWKEQDLLPSELYSESKAYLEMNPDLSFLPKATPASADVFLPPLPVVFKLVGERKSVDRFYRMSQVRNLCQKNYYTRLVVPKATPHGPFIIEEKLPLKEKSQKEQIGLYSENANKFSLAVREFTGLLFETIYCDILTHSHPYRQEIPLARYDNIPLFIEDGVGKIGLVDLEEVSVREEEISEQDAIQIYRTAVSLFPLHSMDIHAAFQGKLPHISLVRKELKQYIDEVLANFYSVYKNHRDFLERKGINSKIYPLRLERQKDLKELAKDSLVAQQFLEEMIEKMTESCGSINTQNLSISDVCNRVFNFIFPDVIKDLDNSVINFILDNLKLNEDVCFVSLYCNRAGKMRIRIDF